MILKTNYFCLIAGLPDITIDETKSLISSSEFKLEIFEQLKPADYKLAEMLYFKYDNENLLNIILKKDKPFNNLGKYTQEELEEQIKEPTHIEVFMKQFIVSYKKEEAQVSELFWENKLQALYFDFVLQTKNEFLKMWFEFEIDIKNILTAVNSHKYKYDVKKQLIYTKQRNDVYENLIKETPKLDSLSDEVIYAEKILQIAESNDKLSKKEKDIDILKLKYLEEFTFFKYFNIEKVLAFIIILNIAERWAKLNNKTGKELFEKIIKNLQFSIDN